MKVLYEKGDIISCVIPGNEEVSNHVVLAVNIGELINGFANVSYVIEYLGGTHIISDADVKTPATLFNCFDCPNTTTTSNGLLSWKEGLEPRPDNDTLPEIVTLLMAIQYDKEGHYGSSWKGKGEYRGIMSNIDRKYDRLDNITNAEIQGTMNSLAIQENMLKDNYELYSEQIGESKVDAIADLANYSIMYLGWVKQNFPLVFQVWVDKNLPKYLADKIDFLSKPNQQ